MITERGLETHRWSVIPGGGGMWIVMSSQRCCAWFSPTQAWGLRLVDLFEWAHAHPELPDAEDLGITHDLDGPRPVGSFKTHLRHMREGVVFPMKAEDFR
jgi:hypothetical protein